MDKKWFAVWVQTGQEEAVLEKLDRLKTVEVLLPREKLWERHGGEWRQEERAIFPGYIFLHCYMTTGIYYAVRDIPHVIGWLGKDTVWPGIIPDAQMAPFLLIAGGKSPEEALTSVTKDKRTRRGYGSMTLRGKEYKIPFDIYGASETAPSQPEEAIGDASL